MSRTALPRRDPAADAKTAAGKAQALVEAAQPARADHPYAARKQIVLPPSVREMDAAAVAQIIGYPPRADEELLAGRLLLVPIIVGESLSTVEMIDESGRKSALAGGRKGGGYWTAAPLPDCDWTGDLTLLVGEGVATVISASMACPDAIGVAALSCGNLLAVGRMLRERYPQAKIVFLADLGIGERKCAEAARAVGGLVATPTFGDES
jgi:putative DNA primase/helicase